ncbi:MAG: tol-pal system protein YbgF [Acidiferrobacteraceae bacterium]|nr:tol-pal system protein YbgF [Acidiferrobacteraceae bacterium]
MISARLKGILSRISDGMMARMVFLFAASLLFFYLPALPVLADCPPGTRNNYKGECIVFISQADEGSSTAENSKKWVEPTGDNDEVDKAFDQSSESGNAISGSTISESVSQVEVDEVSIDIETNSTISESVSQVEVDEVSIDIETNSLVSEVEKSEITDRGNVAAIKTISLIQELREEIQELLNRIELQRYELEKLRTRQIDLYQDLDNRVRTQERLTLVVPSPEMPSVDAIITKTTEVDAVVDEPSPLIVEEAVEDLVENVGQEDREIVTNSDQDRSSDISSPPNPIIVGDGDNKEEIVEEIEIEALVSEEDEQVVFTEVTEPPIFTGTVEIVIESNEESLQQVTATPLKQRSQESDLIATDNLPDENLLSIMLGPEVNDPTEWATSVSEQLNPTPSPIVSNVVKNDSNREELSDSPRASNFDEMPDQLTLKSETNSNISTSSPTQSARVQNKPDEQSVVLSTTVSLEEQESYDQAFNMLKQSRYEEAALEFANFLRTYRNSQLTDDAWYWMAEAYYVSRNYDEALKAYQTVVNYFTNSPRIPASRLKIGYIQYEISDYESSRETLTTLLQDFPAHRVAVSAQARLRKMDRENK